MKGRTVAINPTIAQKVHLCSDDLTGTKLNAAITVTESQRHRAPFSKEGAETISVACTEVCGYLHEEIECQWTGIFRVVLTIDPSSETFKIDFYYEVMIFGDYTENCLQELIEDITETLSEIVTVQEQPLTLDFRVRKAFT